MIWFCWKNNFIFFLKKFEMVNLGEIQYILEIQMNNIWQDQTIYLTQHKYIVGILRCFDIAKSKLTQTPFIIGYGFSKWCRFVQK